MRSKFAVACLVTLTVSTCAQAQQPPLVFARESFLFGENGSGYLFGPLQEQNPVVAPGFVTEITPWESNSSAFLWQPESLFSSTYEFSRGGSIVFDPRAGDDLNVASRRADEFPRTNTYYLNFLVNSGKLEEFGTGHALVGYTGEFDIKAYLGEEGAEPMAGALVGFASDFDVFGNQQLDLVIRTQIAPDMVGDIVVLPDVLEATTYQIVLKIDVDNDGPVDLLDYWVNPRDTSSEDAMSETALVADRVATYSIPELATTDHLTLVAENWKGFFQLDELGIGNSQPILLAPIFNCDLNGDGLVDASDMGLVFANWGKPGIGDVNGDGVVDAADAGVCFAEWTAEPAIAVNATSISEGMAAVPEPHPWAPMLVLLAGLSLPTRPPLTSRGDR